MGIFAFQESFDGSDLTKQGPAPRAIDPHVTEGNADLREQGRQPGEIDALMRRRSFRGHLDGADQNGVDQNGAGCFEEAGPGTSVGSRKGPRHFGREYH